MNCYGITDIGKKRSSNQDRFSILVPESENFSCILTVCDGMGGANGGEIASTIALDTYSEALTDTLDDCDGEGGTVSALSRASNLANRAVFSLAEEKSELNGMGTTLVSALSPSSGDFIYLINIGDSRAYLINADEIKQISHDHSYVQRLVDMGDLSPSKASNHPGKNLLTRAIGIEEEVIPDVKKISTRGYEYLLLCSDGLHGEVKDAEIKKTVLDRSICDVRAKAEALVALANKKGGGDNVTVILARLSSDGN